MRVLVTGGSGFIGHHVVEHILSNTDWEIVVLDSFRNLGTSSRIRYILDNTSGSADRLKVMVHDLTAPIDHMTAQEIGDIEVIFNLASESHVDRSISDPVPFIHNNVLLATTVFEYARTLKNLKAVIQISTDEVYGPVSGDVMHKEWAPILPSNPYSASKAAQEAIAISYWRTYDLPIIISNTMNVAGERQNVEKFIPKVVNSILMGNPISIHAVKDGDSWISGSRRYLDVKNQADALLFIVNKALDGHPVKYSDGLKMPERINVAGEQEIFNDEMVSTISDILGIKASVYYVDFKDSRPGHDLHYGLDGEKLASWGWTPPVSLKDSIVNIVNWYKNNPSWLN